MPPTLRLSGLVRLGAILFAFLFILHILASLSSSPSSSSSYPSDSAYYDTGLLAEDEAGGWGERLGLDHYAEWEDGVRGRLGTGLGRLSAGVGMLKGGLGIGAKGAKLGSLYEVTLPFPFSRVEQFSLPLPMRYSSFRHRIRHHDHRTMTREPRSIVCGSPRPAYSDTVNRPLPPSTKTQEAPSTPSTTALAATSSSRAALAPSASSSCGIFSLTAAVLRLDPTLTAVPALRPPTNRRGSKTSSLRSST